MRYSLKNLKETLRVVGYENVEVVYATDYKFIKINENTLQDDVMVIVFVNHTEIERYGTPEPFIVNNREHSVVRAEKVTYIGVNWNRTQTMYWNTEDVVHEFIEVEDIVKLFTTEEKLAEALWVESKRRLLETITSSANRILENMKIQLRNEKDNQQQHVRMALLAAENIAKLDKDIMHFKVDKDITEKTEKEIELIHKHKSVKSLSFDGYYLVIRTDTLYITEPNTGRTYLLGEMEIKYNLNDGDLVFTNLTEENRRKSYWGSGCHHPHICYDGDACLGTASAQIAQYTTEREYYAAFLTILSFLRTVDIDDPAGWNVARWDEVDKDGNIIKEGHAPYSDEYDGYGEPYYGDDEDGESWECPVCGSIANFDEGIYVECCQQTVCTDCAYGTYDDNYVCQDCIDNRTYVECVACGNYVHIDEVIENGGNYYCPNCDPGEEEEE